MQYGICESGFNMEIKFDKIFSCMVSVMYIHYLLARMKKLMPNMSAKEHGDGL